MRDCGEMAKKLRTGHRVLILIDEVLGDVLHHESVGLTRHPCVHERGKIESWRAVKL